MKRLLIGSPKEKGSTMAHTVRFYENFDLTETHEYSDWDAALSVAQDRWTETSNVFSARIYPDHTGFDDLADFIAAENASADWLEAHPQEGCFITSLTPSLSYWSKVGVTTPEQLARCLAIETYSDFFKDVNGFRPRVGLSDLSLEELNARIDRLAEAT